MTKKILPSLLILILSLALTYTYFSPLLNGKKLVGHDDKTAAGGSQEIKTYYQEEGEVSKWTNSMFGGMPAYTIWAKDFNPIKSVKRGLESIGHYPVSIMILIFLGAYLCLILFGISPWLSIVGALLYGFASYYYILIGAGHVTKVLSLAYMSPLIAAIYYTYNKSAIKGGILTGLLLAFQIGSSHPQIVYYTLIAVLLFAVAFFIDKIRTGSLNETLKPTLILVLAAVLAVGTNSSYLLTMKEYSTYSTRGQNELTKDNNTGETGLDKDYILDYSYDFTEAFTAFIPRLKGGSMAEPLSENSNLYKEFEKRQGKQQAKKNSRRHSALLG